MTNMKLSQILENVKVKNEYIDVEITDVTADSRKVEKGSLFVCIKGASFDGHSVAEKMLEKGMLEPLKDIQKKSVFSVFIYN